MPVAFRFADEHDAPAIQAIYAPYCEDTPISFELVAPPAEEMAQRIRRVGERLPWLVCEHDQRVLGYVYASPHRERAAYRWSVDVAVYIGSQCHRAGLGRGLYTSLFRILAVQGHFKAYAGVVLPNPASVGLHQAVGFEPIGVYRGVGYKFGAWHDVAWWQKTLKPEVVEPCSPQSIGEVRESAEVQDALRAGMALVRAERLP